jgi:hypothetical protein
LESLPDESSSIESSPIESSPIESSSIERWWHAYGAADGAERLRLVREKLESIAPDDEWFKALFPEAILDLESKLPEEEYVAFLEELRTKHSEVFRTAAEWHAHSMVFYYVAEARWLDVDRTITHFAEDLSKVHESFFSIMSIIRLANRREATQQLIDAAFSLDLSEELMPWALDELMQWALFEPYQNCVNAGCTTGAMDAVYDYAVKIGMNQSRQMRDHQREFAKHLAGRADAWSRDVLLKDDRRRGRRFYLLGADFLRWLCESRGIEPLVADELRLILLDIIDCMECSPTTLLLRLRRQDLEPALAAKVGFMSLDRAHAPAGIVAIRQFYDFLAASELIEPSVQKSAHALTYVLWKDVKRALKDDWRHYQFLERYLPHLTDA